MSVQVTKTYRRVISYDYQSFEVATTLEDTAKDRKDAEKVGEELFAQAREMTNTDIKLEMERSVVFRQVVAAVMEKARARDANKPKA